MIKKAVEVSHLVKRYNKADINAVDDISFSIESGEFFAFLGPNGAGKTTTISILNTTLEKTSGSVMVTGYDLERYQNKIRSRIGIIFQNPSLDQNLTAEENIRLHAILYGLYSFRPTFSLMSADYKNRVHNLAEVLGIEKDMFKPVKTFSGGMKRKLEIVRSLMHEPKILFLDEPTSGLDPLSRRNLWEYLRKVRHDTGMTVFLTTHYLEEAEGVDNLIIINKGKIIAHGAPRQIKEKLLSEYLLLGAQQRDTLISELKKLKLNHKDEGGLIKVELKSKTAQQIIQSIKTPLQVLKVYSPTLEEAYLSIIQTHEGN